MERTLAEIRGLYDGGNLQSGRFLVKAQIVRVEDEEGGEDLSYLACARCARGTVIRKICFSSNSQVPSKCNCGVGFLRSWRFKVYLRDRSVEGLEVSKLLQFKVWTAGARLIPIGPTAFAALKEEDRLKFLDGETMRGVWELEVCSTGLKGELTIVSARRPVPAPRFYDASSFDLTEMAEELVTISQEEHSAVMKEFVEETSDQLVEVGTNLEECWNGTNTTLREIDEVRSALVIARESIDKISSNLRKLKTVV